MSRIDGPSSVSMSDGCQHTEVEVHHAVHMLRRLNEQRLSQDPTCDFTLIAGSQSFKVHKAVLVASSEYFRAMLHGPMIESTCDEVELKAVSPEALSALVTFVYTGRLPLSWKTVADVVHAASHLQVDDALDRCCSFLVDPKTTDAAPLNLGSGDADSLVRLCDLARLAETYALAPVADHVNARLALSFDRLVELPEYAELSAAALARLLQLDCLAVGSELTLFRHVDKWLHAQVPPCSAEDIVSVFGKLRYATMTREELHCVSETKIVGAAPPLGKLVKDALEYHRQLDIGLSPYLCAPSQRRCRNLEDGLIVAVDGSNSKPFQIMACRCGQGPRDGFGEREFYCLYSDNAGDSRTCGFTAIDGFLYVLSLVDVGGFDQDRFLSVSRIDPRGLHATCELQRPSRSRQVGAVVACGHYIYALGGAALSGAAFVADCDRYDVTKNVWESISSLPYAAHFTAAAERWGELYLSGGQSRPSGLLSRSCWSFKPAAVGGSWQSLPDMISARRCHAMVALNDKIYVLGGLCDSPASLVPIESFDVVSYQWTQMETPMTVRGTSVGHYIAIDHSIYVLGHELYNSVEDEIWRLHPPSDHHGATSSSASLQEERVAIMPRGISLGYSFAAAMKLNFSDLLISEKKVLHSQYRVTE